MPVVIREFEVVEQSPRFGVTLVGDTPNLFIHGVE